MKKYSFNNYFLFVFLFVSTFCTAQKSGHINFGNLLSQMQETKTADSELETYQNGLIQKGDAMVSKLQADYDAFVKEMQSGSLLPAKQLERQDALQKQQQEIAAFEQQMKQDVEQKRQLLLMAIIEKATNAIKEVAVENGYEAVFDTSMFNAVLYTVDSDDLMLQVKSKLGI